VTNKVALVYGLPKTQLKTQTYDKQSGTSLPVRTASAHLLRFTE